ncbi:hypothetical protein ACFO25_13405 [Paenactinomyces guangxiensis]|uniref:Uncharacterized protein n=1 Tax=Paenactinomyces guangxiensis TaxID=1490290 RepID=A0A7W2A7T2_9BACL|nr:hypothetical protein [Paenactinomyces guangxiensis]MBA4493442.1 hypothetical protein [Paenactinomyces guangxiensis]MBH8590533.1 hypothetical protein [Paenactinomyces guangxiensis]
MKSSFLYMTKRTLAAAVLERIAEECACWYPRDMVMELAMIDVCLLLDIRSPDYESHTPLFTFFYCF